MSTRLTNGPCPVCLPGVGAHWGRVSPGLVPLHPVLTLAGAQWLHGTYLNTQITQAPSWVQDLERVGNLAQAIQLALGPKSCVLIHSRGGYLTACSPEIGHLQRSWLTSHRSPEVSATLPVTPSPPMGNWIVSVEKRVAAATGSACSVPAALTLPQFTPMVCEGGCATCPHFPDEETKAQRGSLVKGRLFKDIPTACDKVLLRVNVLQPTGSAIHKKWLWLVLMKHTEQRRYIVCTPLPSQSTGGAYAWVAPMCVCHHHLGFAQEAPGDQRRDCTCVLRLFARPAPRIFLGGGVLPI